MDMQQWIRNLKKTGPKKTMPILSFPVISLMNVSVRTLVSDSDLQAKGMKMIADRCPTSATVSMMDLSVEAEAFGCQTKVPDDEVPTVVGRLLTCEADVERLKIPPPGSGRTGLYVQAIRKAREQIRDRPVFAGVIGPFSLAGRLMDMSEIMVNCYEEPEMVTKTLEKAGEFIASYINEYKKAGANGVVMAEPAAGLLSPDLCEEFSSRHVKRIADQVRSKEFLFIYHNCGNTIPLKDSLMGIGADAYHLGNAIDIEEMLKIVPPDVLIMGNVDPAGMFRLGTPETMRAKTLELLERCSQYPNYAISSGCDIPPLAPWNNIDAFFGAIDEFYAGR
ncbi:MAG: uroporphyrinogen decarboxylase family protein [Planctomycetes bacterium]|nr:uroporphyrinogen decarboxylase family protein [Planctomycetota bacterium]